MGRFFTTTAEQDRHYQELVDRRRPTKLFSCGYAERFDPFLLERKPFLVPVYERLFAAWFPEPVDSILDLGCGTGLYWPVLRKHCRSLVGIDVSAAMLAEAGKLIDRHGWDHVRTLPFDGDRLPEEIGPFDAILCMDVLHHIPRLDLVLPQLPARMKPGGRLLALEPNILNPLMFLAHALPPEERYAIIRNVGPKLRRLLHPYFEDIAIDYDYIVLSLASEAQLRMLQRVGGWMARYVPFGRRLGFRLSLSARRRAVLPEAPARHVASSSRDR